MNLRRLIPIIFCINFFVFSFSPPSLAEEAIVNVDNLNIRSGPSTEKPRIGQAQMRDVFPIIQKQGDWVEIQLEKDTGWIHADYLTMYEKAKGKKKNDTNHIIEEKTHLRSGPSTYNDIIYLAEKGEAFQILSETGDWYELSNNKTTGYALKESVETEKIHYPTNPLRNKTIVIDAGHGGYDVGAVGTTGSYEKDLTYLTAKELESELTILGANVLLTRSRDEFVSLGSRASFSNISNADVFISIHYNSFQEQPEVTGIETFYYYEEYKKLAQHIQEGIIKSTNSRDRGIEQGDLFVLRKNTRPAVLLELGFISNKESETKLKTKAYQKQIVSGIVNGLRTYFMNEY